MSNIEPEKLNIEQAKILGKNVRAARLSMRAKEPWDWSQEKTADKLMMTQQGYQKIEAGKIISPRQETLIKIANLFNTTVDYLFGRSSNSQPLAVYSELNPAGAPQPIGLIPVLTPEQVVSNYIENGGSLDDIKVIPVYSRDELGYRVFIVDSDSMTRKEGFSVEKGAEVIYSPNTEPVSGNLVIVKLSASDKKAYLRQYINEGGTKGFKPFNESYDFTPLGEDTIIYGVAKRKIVDVPF